MRIRTFLVLPLLAGLAATLAACGGKALPAEPIKTMAPTTADASVHGQLLPVFAPDGSVLRAPGTELAICDETSGVPEGEAPAFAADGSVLRCPTTGEPLYRAEWDGEPVLVRDGGR